MDDTMKNHWEHIYSSKEIDRLGWYEETPEPSISLISRCRTTKDDPVLDVGTGASTLIDYLLDQGYKNIIAVDISDTALQKLRKRLGKEKSRRVRWITDDITKPVYINKLIGITLWHDRALLHFLLGEKERKSYLTTLKKVLKKGGYVIIAYTPED